MSEPAEPVARGTSWLDKATDDLRIAEVVLESAIGIERAVCFHSQQAAEKAIKGLLVHLDVDFPTSRSLDRLASLLPGDATEHLDLEALTELNPRAVAGRYPEDIENPTIEEAERIPDNARHIVDVVRQLMDPQPGSTPKAACRRGRARGG